MYTQYLHISNRICALQIGADHKLFPLLPPNRFLYLDKKRLVEVMKVDDARWHYNTYLGLRGWNKKRRKYVEGALYTNIFFNWCRKINLGKGERVDIQITTEDNVVSTVSIIREKNVQHPQLQHCTNLGKVLSKYTPNTFRKNCHDRGKMYVVGNGKLGSSQIGTYRVTENKDVQDALSSLSNADIYYNGIGLAETVRSIRHKKKYSSHPSMGDCFVSNVTSSCNYINAAHLDVDDCCEGIITWTIDGDDVDNDIYFILPNVTVDGHKATIIKIYNGMTIKN